MSPSLPPPLLFRQPARLGIGPGCAAGCPRDLAALGLREVLLVASASALPAAGDFLAACEAAGLRLRTLTGIPAEPSVKDFEHVLAQARATSLPEVVIGLGGGSVLDVAKLVAALVDKEQGARPFFGNGLLPGRKPLLVAIPTTAGAGSEASPNAILYDELEGLKKAVISPFLVPDASYIDASLALGVPAAVTAATGLDALTHCIEAYANRKAHPVVDTYALEGVRLIGANLAAAVRDGNNLGARSALALGSYYGGLCLGPVNTAAVHALSYPLGSRFRLAHGLSNAMLLPAVIRFNLPACPSRYAALGRALGLAGTGDDQAGALAFARQLETLARECGLPSSLSSLGVRAEDLPAMADDALKIQRLLVNNPREVLHADAVAIYQQSL